MHENREISGTSRSNQDRDRSEKAISRTAGRQVPEESDRAVVPVNLPNKEEQSSAEAEEERARTKENIAQSNTHPTQSGNRVSQGLRGVRQAAKEREARTVHRFAPLEDRFTPGQLLRIKAAGCTRGGRRHLEGV